MREDDEDRACLSHHVNENQQKPSEEFVHVRYMIKTISNGRLMVAFSQLVRAFAHQFIG